MVDDDAAARTGTARFLELEGYRVRTAASGAEALRLFEEQPPEVVLSDTRMPGMDGLQLLDALRGQGFTGPVVLVAAVATVESAVAAMQRGASHYLEKPLDLERLLHLLAGYAAERKGPRAGPASEAGSAGPGFELIGTSPPMQRLVEAIRTAAASTAPVLIQGETGSGKEMVARMIHAYSDRKRQPFVPLHCAALAEGVLESELFGHEKGAFTGAIGQRKGRFELADKGTLFLDELGEMGPSVQVKLLRVLEHGSFERVGGTQTVSVDVRLVSATHRDVAKEVEAGRFREDLFYRLNVITLRLPPLRERPEDIPLLAREFLRKYSSKNQKRLLGFTPEALDCLVRYSWPGNVRELESVVQRAVIFTKGLRIDPSALTEPVRAGGVARADHLEIKVGTPLKAAERALILRTLESCGQNKTKAARLLGISARKIAYKLAEWGIR